MEIIAEIGQNHNGDMKLAFELIHAAKENGADVAKFQLYDAKALFPQGGNEWYEYNCQTEISRDELSLLFDECEKVGIEFMASVFDMERIEWLEDVGVKRHKIASRSINDTRLIESIVQRGKPVLLSLGMWDKETLPAIESPAPLHYLYCISKYPTPLDDLKLSAIDFNNKYYGFSDHTIGITSAVVAFSRGARIVEKHFTLDKSMYGPDHICSMNPEELRSLDTFRNEIAQCL